MGVEMIKTQITSTWESFELWYTGCNKDILICIAACGGHLIATDRVKHLYSHARYGHHPYDHKTDCDWIIEAPLGKNVHLSFRSFQLEYEIECGYDFVEVFSGLDASSPPYGRFCGNSVSTLIQL